MTANHLCKGTPDDPQGTVGMTTERMKPSLRIGFEHVQAGAMVIVGYSAPQDTKQMVQGLEFRRVRGQVDQFQPAAMALQQCGDLSRFLRPVDVGIVDHHEGRTPSTSGAPDERIAQDTEREAVAPVGVAAQGCAVPPIGGGKKVALPIGPGRRDLPLVAPPRPAAGERGQQRELGFVLHVDITSRRRIRQERLGAGPFAWYWGSRRRKCRTVQVGRRTT